MHRRFRDSALTTLAGAVYKNENQQKANCS
jgi:hypothetical protein